MSNARTDTASWSSRAIGTVVGSAVGDALGAPFEFQLGGAFRARFGDGTGEMCGGGGWDPGEATDDTQMAVTGALAGAAYGAQSIPTRWTDPLHVPLPGFAHRVLRFPELRRLALDLTRGGQPGTEPRRGQPAAPPLRTLDPK
jgi:ADP-ribosylglycohydrolase